MPSSAAALDAEAQANRGSDAGGRVSCVDGPSEATVGWPPATPPKPSGLVVAHYDVHGLDGAALLADLARRGPHGFHGMTNWQYDYRYQYEPAPRGGCRVASVVASVSGRILLPRWVDEARAPAALRATWQRYVAALMRHEEGHIANGQSLNRALQAGLGSLSDATCDALRARVDRTAQALIDDHRDRDARYDAETRHGTTQGAFLSLP